MLNLAVATRNRLSCVKNAYFQVRHLSTQTKAKDKSDLMADFKQRLPAVKPRKPNREPFVKNLFLGKFDYEFLTYPEAQSPDRYTEFEEWIRPLNEYMDTVNAKEFEDTNTIPPHVLQKLRELGVFGARIHEDYQGMNLLDSEFLRVLEAVSTVPALGLFLLKQAVGPINIFNKYCSVEQKLKYLPKIAQGQSLATVAITEDSSGPAVKNFDTIATLSMDDKYWILDGEKTFVSNAHLADVFIVFGHGMQSGRLERRPETLSSFIVEANTPGVTVAKDSIETIGLKGFNTGRIILKNVEIPKENMIGELGMGAQQLLDLFTKGRHFIAALSISLLKNFLRLLTEDVIHRKHFNKLLRETDAAKQVFANITQAIYAIESVLYLTSGTMDTYDNQDVELETALVEQYSVQTTLQVIQDSMWLVGPRACTLVKPFEKIFRDAFTLTNYEISLFDTKIYSALLGLQHYGLNMGEVIKKERNILMNPYIAFEKLFSSTKESLNLHLEEYLHPAFQDCTQFCDRSLYKLVESARNMLVNDGTNIVEKDAELQRLSDMVSFIYVYIATIGRASRSYCIGNRNAESEVKITMAMSWKLQQEVVKLAEDIRVNEYVNGDYIGKDLANLHYECKKYIAAHPLQRNY